VAEWLVEQGARYVVLAGRSAPSDVALEAVARMERTGARVLVSETDVSRTDELAHLLETAARELPPFAGIVHSAGVLDDGIVVKQTWDRFAAVAAPKVKGAWALHKLMASELDFFVLFSSAASIAGAAGQASHASANAFLDALSSYRAARGLPATSINWGQWAEIGTAADRGVDTTPGVAALAPADGLAALEHALRTRSLRSQLVVLSIDWPAFLAGHAPGTEPSLYAELVEHEPSSDPGIRPDPRGDVRPLAERIAAAAPARRLRVVEDSVRQEAARVLGLTPTQIDDLDRPLNELGLDSLMAVELRNRLGSALGSTLPATLLFEYPSVRGLAEYLASEWLGLAPASTELASDGGSYLDSLSDEAVAELLERKLDRIGER
jgi:acyl carrier protein/NAD(P)-dependent dehydrogenase (short-subunit alcohol dehydrogenase family)